MAYFSSGYRRLVSRIHVASLSGDACAGVFATFTVKNSFGRCQVVVVQVGSVVVPHDCGVLNVMAVEVVCLVPRVSKRLQ
jgi:hypothetical protein